MRSIDRRRRFQRTGSDRTGAQTAVTSFTLQSDINNKKNSPFSYYHTWETHNSSLRFMGIFKRLRPVCVWGGEAPSPLKESSPPPGALPKHQLSSPTSFN